MQRDVGFVERSNGFIGTWIVGDLPKATSGNDAENIPVSGDGFDVGSGLDVRLLAFLCGAGKTYIPYVSYFFLLLFKYSWK